jgi:hypothetical protein
MKTKLMLVSSRLLQIRSYNILQAAGKQVDVGTDVS